MSEPKKPLPADESSVTSLSMLKGVWAKNPTAWDLLVTKYGITVYSWCRQRGLGEHDAQDVCQEVFASVARKFDEYQQKTQSGGLKNWLYVITRNKLTDYWRLNQRREQARGGSSWQVFLGCIADPLEGSSAIGLGATNGQLAKIVDRVRCESSDQDWQIFSRTVIHGETAQEVARAHGVNVNVVYLAKSRVLKRLRETCKVLLSGG
ncbi:MAG: sigma-70 family RNA polymerase sigma factor [Planctomycetota bacterium]|nr:sigma-70 family RNA polymerase sigma factor [Planctomycetota bacterium]